MPTRLAATDSCIFDSTAAPKDSALSIESNCIQGAITFTCSEVDPSLLSTATPESWRRSKRPTDWRYTRTPRFSGTNSPESTARCRISRRKIRHHSILAGAINSHLRRSTVTLSNPKSGSRGSSSLCRALSYTACANRSGGVIASVLATGRLSLALTVASSPAPCDWVALTPTRGPSAVAAGRRCGCHRCHLQPSPWAWVLASRALASPRRDRPLRRGRERDH